MTPRFRRTLYSLAALVWSGVLLYFYASGRIARYLAPDFHPLVLAGGLGLAVLGLFVALTSGCPANCGHGGGETGHDHEAGDLHPLFAFGVMVLPLAFAAYGTTDRFSAATLARKGLYDTPASIRDAAAIANIPPLTREDLATQHPPNAAGYHPFSLLELFFATGDREMQSVLDGLKVETEGHWMDERAEGGASGNRRRLYRLFLTCCVADSRAIPIILEFAGPPPGLPANEWVKVAGTIRFKQENGVNQAVLEAVSATPAPPPPEEAFMRGSGAGPR